MTSIVPLALGHCSEVAALHLHHLRTGFWGKPGLRLLEAYYAMLTQSGGGCGFVAVGGPNPDPSVAGAETGQAVSPPLPGGGQVVGYVCGVWALGMVRAALVRRRWKTLILWGGAQVVIRPQLLRPWLQGAFAARVDLHRRTKLPADEGGYELRPIVVMPTARGLGIGTQLVQALLADASRRGLGRVHVYVEEENTAAIALYRKTGFRPVGERSRADRISADARPTPTMGGEVSYLRYEYSFSQL